MSFTADDRRAIVSAMDRIDNAARELVLATFDAFVAWLKAQLRAIYKRIKDDLKQVWRTIRSSF